MHMSSSSGCSCGSGSVGGRSGGGRRGSNRRTCPEGVVPNLSTYLTAPAAAYSACAATSPRRLQACRCRGPLCYSQQPTRLSHRRGRRVLRHEGAGRRCQQERGQRGPPRRQHRARRRQDPNPALVAVPQLTLLCSAKLCNQRGAGARCVAPVGQQGSAAADWRHADSWGELPVRCTGMPRPCTMVRCCSEGLLFKREL